MFASFESDPKCSDVKFQNDIWGTYINDGSNGRRGDRFKSRDFARLKCTESCDGAKSPCDLAYELLLNTTNYF